MADTELSPERIDTLRARAAMGLNARAEDMGRVLIAHGRLGTDRDEWKALALGYQTGLDAIAELVGLPAWSLVERPQPDDPPNIVDEVTERLSTHDRLLRENAELRAGPIHPPAHGERPFGHLTDAKLINAISMDVSVLGDPDCTDPELRTVCGHLMALFGEQRHRASLTSGPSNAK